MTFRSYLKWAVLLVAIDATVLTYFYSADLDSGLARPLFVMKGALDCLFILSNLRKAQMSRIEIIILLVLALHAIGGMIIFPMISSSYLPSRAFNDVFWPVIFVLKVAIIRNLTFEDVFSAADWKSLSLKLIGISLVQVAIFLFFSRYSGAYAGITPPVNLPFAYGVALSHPMVLLLSLVLIVLSGKRAYLLAAVAVFAVRAIVRRQNRSAFIVLGIVGVIALTSAVGGAAAGLIPTAVLEKFVDSSQVFNLIGIIAREGFGVLSEDVVRRSLYAATAGRSEEFLAIIGQMTWSNFFFGLGAGFTYSYLHWDGWVDGYANSHFSPLSLTYKFGVFYMLIIYIYIFRGTLKLFRSQINFAEFLGIGLMLFFVQSIFAYNLFAEIFLPLLVGLRAAALRVESIDQPSVKTFSRGPV